MVYGIDNTFAGRAIDAGILSPYTSPDLPKDAGQYAADDSNSLTPIDYGDVCLNADTTWFEKKGIAVPQTLDDLLKPEYKNLLVVENPATSSPGMAFLAATVGAMGEDGYLDYWTALKTNGVKVVKGWTEAYTVQFSGSSGKGAYPLVVSYSTSPAYEHATQALTRTCFRQVEYAGVLAGARNPRGGAAVVELLSPRCRPRSRSRCTWTRSIPTSSCPPTGRSTPPWWTTRSPCPRTSRANRDAWIKAWTAAVIG